MSAEDGEMQMDALRRADPDARASDYIKGVPGTVGELLDALETHGVEGIEAAEGIGPVTASAVRRALSAPSAGPGDEPVEHESGDADEDPLAAELKRRHRAGESHVALAEAFGLMPSRVARLTRG